MPVRGNILYCPDCKYEHDQVNLITCLNCGHDLGAPNVNMVSTDEEMNSLHKRYETAVDHLKSKNLETILDSFVKYFNTNVKAIINLDLTTLNGWINNNTAYQPYFRSVESGLRLIAKFNNDQKRIVYDSVFYGSYGIDIVFAALTLNDKGIDSYGNCSIILKDDSIKIRASILEENIYTFVLKHNINLADLNIPKGYRSNWDGKEKLAVTKLSMLLNDKLKESDYTGLVLKSTTDRSTDEFIEVHIYKEINPLAAKSIVIPIPKNTKDGIIVKKIEEKLPGIVTRI